MKQRGHLKRLEPTTSTLRVRRATHCATPPLNVLLTKEPFGIYPSIQPFMYIVTAWCQQSVHSIYTTCQLSVTLFGAYAL